MARARLSGKVGAALDPCAAIQVGFELAPGQERQFVFRMGVGGSSDDARAHVARFRGAAAARQALESVWDYWKRTLGAVQVETPDESINVLANGWLVYQTLACRLWARSGYYQSGGAFGFRDQLQDVMALVHAEPRLVRAAPAAVREPAVRRGRRPALVASTARSRRTHALLGRLPLVAACDLSLRIRDRRYGGPRRGRAVSSKGARSTRRTSPTTTCPADHANPPRCTSIACAPCATGSGSASTACR